MTRTVTPDGWNDPATALKDGTMLHLLIQPGQEELDAFTSFHDSREPYETIGFNQMKDTLEDVWQFAGWDWCHDCITEGHGEVIGWLPFGTTAPSPQPNVQGDEPDAIEQSYRAGFVDGGKEFSDNLQHAQETVRGLQRILEELSEKQISSAVIDVIKERRRQINVEDFRIDEDDHYTSGEMAWAATCYLQNAAVAAKMQGLGLLTASQCDERGKSLPKPEAWPWDAEWWKPTGQRRDLVKAAALTIAEIERLDRAAASEGSKP